jgi:hypothetical protein
MIWLDILLVVALLLIVSGTVELLPPSLRPRWRVQSPAWTANPRPRICAKPTRARGRDPRRSDVDAAAKKLQRAKAERTL